MRLKKKVSHFSYLVVLIVYFMAFLSASLVYPSSASALDTANFSIYPGDEFKDPGPVNNAYNKDIASGGSSQDPDYYKNGGFNSINILVKDFLGTGPLNIPYDPSTSSNFGKEVNTAGSDKVGVAKELIFTKDYFCSIPDNKISFEAPSGSGYYEIKYAIGLDPITRDNTKNDFFNQDKFTAYGGTVSVAKIEAGQPKNVLRNLSGDQYGPSDLASVVDGDSFRAAAPAACIPDSVARKGTLTNYYKLSADQKREFADAKTAAIASANDSNSEDPCKSSGLSLSWIICPVLELGYTMTDYVFGNLIQPLLENIAISTDPNDGSFKAWKSFRTLGNIVLIGALVAVVYAQVRSDN